MSKPKQIRLEGYEFFFWKYELQTRMKHQILDEYFKNWAVILGKYNKVCYFDCFGGCGAYIDDREKSHYGSPFRIAKIANELRKQSRDIEIYVSEFDKENYENLSLVPE